MKPEQYFKNGKAYVWKETFAIVKARKIIPYAFAVIQDKNEITVIIDQNKIKKSDFTEINKDWKLITFDMVLPFSLIGFLAKVSKAMEDEKITVIVVSAYSTDHVLVKKKDISKAIKKLKKLGLVVKTK